MKRLLSIEGVVLAILEKRALRVFIPIVAVLVFSCAVPAAGVTRIMPLGDSITRGWSGSLYAWGYRQPLYVSLTNDGYDFDFVGSKVDGNFPDPNHEGHGGWRADEILNGRESAPAEGKLADWLSAYQPDVILLHIGTNDISQGNQDVNEVDDILDVIDDYEDASDKDVTVILALIINRKSYNYATTRFNWEVNNMALNRIANGDDIIIVDMESALDYVSDMKDDAHPNDVGYAKMAAVWYNALVDYFSGKVLTISGYVLEADSNTPVEGVLIQADGNDISTANDVNGYYELWVDYGWSGVVAAQKDGYYFEPNSFSYTDVNQNYTDINYAATRMTFKIAGFVFEQNSITPISDVNISADNGGGSTLTDANGYYEIVVDYNWSGNVTPSKYAYGFEPNSRYYEDVNQDYTADQNYTGNEFDFRITGYIKNECEVPVEGVLVSADNGGGKDSTDANGFYEVWVDSAWSGTVTPTRQYYTFDPNWMSYVNVLTGQPDQNYVASNVYDLDCDGSIGWGDFGIIANNWPLSGPAIQGDFVVDGTVNFLDFADFQRVWKDR